LILSHFVPNLKEMMSPCNDAVIIL
jgi:hypothetical protein